MLRTRSLFDIQLFKTHRRYHQQHLRGIDFNSTFMFTIARSRNCNCDCDFQYTSCGKVLCLHSTQTPFVQVHVLLIMDAL